MNLVIGLILLHGTEGRVFLQGWSGRGERLTMQRAVLGIITLLGCAGPAAADDIAATVWRRPRPLLPKRWMRPEFSPRSKAGSSTSTRVTIAATGRPVSNPP